jgi:hypothetical protein
MNKTALMHKSCHRGGRSAIPLVRAIRFDALEMDRVNDNLKRRYRTPERLFIRSINLPFADVGFQWRHSTYRWRIIHRCSHWPGKSGIRKLDALAFAIRHFSDDAVIRPLNFRSSIIPSEIMALTIGTQLGSHEVTALLGKSGMGEVYRIKHGACK